jgi:hypothetical protein
MGAKKKKRTGRQGILENLCGAADAKKLSSGAKAGTS